MRRRSWGILVVGFVGCSPSPLPDPRIAARAYAAAAQAGDADAIYGMLSATSRRALTPAQFRGLVSGEKRELAQQSVDISSTDRRVQAMATLRFPDGEEARMEFGAGRFWISAAGALPGAGRTPEETLDALRRVLARRSYAGLLSVLTPSTRAAMEHDFRTLVDGLAEPDSLTLRPAGDTVSVAVPGGHQVTLRREGGLWKVDDFD